MTDAPQGDDDRDEVVLQRALLGQSARNIAKQFKLTTKQINEALDRLLGTVDNEARRRALALDLHRLDKLLQVFLTKAITQSDVLAGTLCVKILERRSLILGLDQPQKLDIVSIQAKHVSSHGRVREAIFSVARGHAGQLGPPARDDNGGGELQ
jgi:hypothetical protein